MKYLILPECTDLNRGDQALVWETIRVAREAGFVGEYYMQALDDTSEQSRALGIKTIKPILLHPSRKSHINNIRYGKMLIIAWGLTALRDLFGSLLVMLFAKNNLFRQLMKKSTQETLKIYDECDAVFVKGGGFLQTYGDITSSYYTYYHLFPIKIALRLQKPVYIMPNSYGPHDGFFVETQINHVLKKCELVYCREEISYAFMQQTYPKIDFLKSYDLGFYLETPKTFDAVSYLHDHGVDDLCSAIAITVRPYRFPNSKNGEKLYLHYIESIIGFCNYLIDKDLFPVFIQHTIAENDHEDDIKCINEICKELPYNSYRIIQDENLCCSQLKKIYSCFLYMIGTRFHSVIFSISSGVPAISVAYGGNKSRGIMRDIGLEDYVINIEDISQEALCEKFEMLAQNESTVRSILYDLKDKLWMERLELIHNLRENKPNE